MPKLDRNQSEQMCFNEKTLLVLKCVHEIQEAAGMIDLIASFACKMEPDGRRAKQLLLTELEISPMECTALFEFLRHIKNLRRIEITKCKMSHSAFCELAKFLQEDNEITDLVLSDVGMTDEDAKHIIGALESDSCKVTHLDLSDNPLTDKSGLESENRKRTILGIDTDKLTTSTFIQLNDNIEGGSVERTERNSMFDRKGMEMQTQQPYAAINHNCSSENL
jgi:hypothetical protein